MSELFVIKQSESIILHAQTATLENSHQNHYLMIGSIVNQLSRYWLNTKYLQAAVLDMISNIRDRKNAFTFSSTFPSFPPHKHFRTLALTRCSRSVQVPWKWWQEKFNNVGGRENLIMKKSRLLPLNGLKFNREYLHGTLQDPIIAARREERA